MYTTGCGEGSDAGALFRLLEPEDEDEDDEAELVDIVNSGIDMIK